MSRVDETPMLDQRIVDRMGPAAENLLAFVVRWFDEHGVDLFELRHQFYDATNIVGDEAVEAEAERVGYDRLNDMIWEARNLLDAVSEVSDSVSMGAAYEAWKPLREKYPDLETKGAAIRASRRETRKRRIGAGEFDAFSDAPVIGD